MLFLLGSVERAGFPVSHTMDLITEPKEFIEFPPSSRIVNSHLGTILPSPPPGDI